MAVITPITREEFYLAKAGGRDVPVPSAVTREEYYLEKLSNDSVVVPTPVTRREKFLYFASGGEIDLPSEDRMTRLERLIAKAGGMDVSTPTAVTRLEKFWANVEGGGWKTITGVLPLTFTAKGGTAADWVIEGNDENGTENLWNENYENISIHATYKPIYVGNGSFTLSTNAPLSDGAALVFLMPGQQSSGGTTARDGVYDGSPRTVTSVDGYVTLIYRIYGNEDPRDYQTMLVKGSTAPDHYIPYQQGVGERTENKANPDNVEIITLNNRYGVKITGAGIWQIVAFDNVYTQVHARVYDSNNEWAGEATVIVNATGTIFLKEITLNEGDTLCIYDPISNSTEQIAKNKIREDKIVAIKSDTAPTTYIPYGYEIPITISQQGQPNKTVDIYIGENPLTEGETVSKTSTGVDIELFEGENTVSTTLYNKPDMEIKYK